MNKKIRQPKIPQRLLAVSIGFLASVLLSHSAFAAGVTYTINADFDLGILDGVNHDPVNQIQLSTTGSTFPVLWIANAGEDTVSRINTDTNKEEGRYRTWFNVGNHSAWTGPAPSRTAVDGDGNVYVANRHFDGRPSEVMKILAEGGIDRNGNGVIDTSTDTNGNGTIDVSEVIPIHDLNANSIVDPNELADERVAWIVRVGGNNGVGRSLCIGTDGNIWAGLYNLKQYYKLSATNGAVLAGPISTGNNVPYGCLVDSDGILWSADRGGSYSCAKLGKLDTNTNTFLGTTATHSGCHYSIGLGKGSDNLKRIYLAIENQNLFREYNPATNSFTGYGATSSRGISADGNDDIVLGRSNIRKHNNSGGTIWSVGNPVGYQDQRGVIVDGNNDVWVVNLNSSSVSKFRGSDGSHLATLPVGLYPYTYSDATGFAFRNSTNPSGLWTVVHDSAIPGIEWDYLSWNNEPEGSNPVGTTLTVEARSADNLVDLSNEAYTPINNSTSGTGLSGQYIGVRVTLKPDADGNSPVLSDLSIAAVPLQCDLDGDFDVDRLDTRIIMLNRNTSVPPGDPAMDIDGNGIINANDARQCVVKCTRPRCAP